MVDLFASFRQSRERSAAVTKPVSARDPCAREGEGKACWPGCVQRGAGAIISPSNMSQEREGIGPHAMWGYTPAQDLLRDSPVKGEVTVHRPSQCFYQQERKGCVRVQRKHTEEPMRKDGGVMPLPKTCSQSCNYRRLRALQTCPSSPGAGHRQTF